MTRHSARAQFPRADLLIVGAGPVGCVVAERAADAGWTSLVVERRPHVAGHCYDVPYGTGVLVHAYGPHYFRTDRTDVVAYHSKFTEWIPARYVVKSSECPPLPIPDQPRHAGAVLRAILHAG